MKLYVYDHCPFCVRARMIFGLKNIPLELQYFLENDVDGPSKLVGKKTTPILEKTDGSHMAESMDIVQYIDGQYGDKIVAPLKEEDPFKAWWDTAAMTVFKLAIPRLTQADLPEFATTEAREAFYARQSKNFGNFDDLLAKTPELIKEVETHLAKLEPVLADYNELAEGDFFIFPLLRTLSIVKGVDYPSNVRSYMKRMEQATAVSLYCDQTR